MIQAETIVPKKGKMQAINNISVKSICLLLCCCLLSCTSTAKLIPTNNKGGYTIKTIGKIEETEPYELIISGAVYDVVTSQPIDFAKLKIFGCGDDKTSTSGGYTYVMKDYSGGDIYLEVNAIGYRTILTNFFKSEKKSILDSIFIWPKTTDRWATVRAICYLI